jgi:hypothetical protein
MIAGTDVHDPWRAHDRFGSDHHVVPSQGLYEKTQHLALAVPALLTDWAWIKQQSRLADRAHQWVEKDRAGTLLLSSPALSDAERWADANPRRSGAV